VKILLVRLRLIGDVVFTTPAIRALRRRFPTAHLTYLVEQGAAPVIAANPHLSEIIAIPHRRGWQRVVDDMSLSKRLRGDRYDIVIDFHGGPRSAWLTWVTRAPVRVGYDVPGRAWMYTHLVHRPRELRARHSVENQWDLLAAVDSAFARPADPSLDRMEMPVEPAARDRVQQRMKEWGVPDDGRVIVLHVSAGNPFRRWPETSFCELASSLVSRSPDRWVLVTGGPSDREATARVIAETRRMVHSAASRVIDAETLSLTELRAAVDRAALYVGGDSGPLHVAGTSDVPVVGLYGPTLPERSAPWRPRNIPTEAVDVGVLPCRPCHQRFCVPGDFRCLTGVTADRVIAAAERLLETPR